MTKSTENPWDLLSLPFTTPTPRSFTICHVSILRFFVWIVRFWQVLTNGRFKSVQHRAVVPKTKPRLSVGYFLKPAESVTLVSAPELVDISQPALYRPFTWTEFVDAHKAANLFPSALPYFQHTHISSASMDWYDPRVPNCSQHPLVQSLRRLNKLQ